MGNFNIILKKHKIYRLSAPNPETYPELSPKLLSTLFSISKRERAGAGAGGGVGYEGEKTVLTQMYVSTCR